MLHVYEPFDNFYFLAVSPRDIVGFGFRARDLNERASSLMDSGDEDVLYLLFVFAPALLLSLIDWPNLCATGI